MPRRSVSSSNTIVYDPIDPPPQQKHFPHRRTSAKPKSTSKLPPKTESQASFTQHFPEYVGMSRSSNQVIANSSGEEEEFKEPRPKKRRRKDVRGMDQPTYTQYVRSAPTRKRQRYSLDEDGFEMFRDEDEVEDTPMDRVRKGLQQRAAGLECTDWTANHDSADETKLEPEIANSSSQLEVMDADATPRAFRTPSKVRFTETIPSSQSPASPNLSTQRSQRYRNVENSPYKRSPLKERNGNMRSPARLQRSPVSEKASQRKATSSAPPSPLAMAEMSIPPPKLQRTLKRVSTVQDSQYEDLELHTPDEEQEQEHEQGHEPELDAEETADETYDYGDSDYEIQPTYDPADAALERDAARFCQTQTQMVKLEPHVSNSTCSDEELLTEDEHEDDLNVGGRAARLLSLELGDAAKQPSQEHEAGYPEEQPSMEVGGAASQHSRERELGDAAQLYDEAVLSSHPAESAVVAGSSPRDFAQFAREQPIPLRSDELAHDEEERIPSSPPKLAFHKAAVADSDELPSEELQAEDERVPSSPPKLTVRKPVSAAIAHMDGLPNDVQEEEENEIVPSSPPPLRPSQISTQCSPDRPASPGKDIPLTFTSPQRPSSLGFTSPQRPHQDSLLAFTSPSKTIVGRSYPQTLPSSPFPLPPWSSPPRRPKFLDTQTQTETQRGGAGNDSLADDQLGSLLLADFSLPPPPPMSSSRAGTQCGGGGSSLSSPLR
ncbi:hypothetical protein LTR85_002527 [Meristemomyces frigidus]|nr:hypothetical protein LTR85_002527 [Meristemomyces frigidus]